MNKRIAQMQAQTELNKMGFTTSGNLSVPFQPEFEEEDRFPRTTRESAMRTVQEHFRDLKIPVRVLDAKGYPLVDQLEEVIFRDKPNQWVWIFWGPGVDGIRRHVWNTAPDVEMLYVTTNREIKYFDPVRLTGQKLVSI